MVDFIIVGCVIASCVLGLVFGYHLAKGFEEGYRAKYLKELAENERKIADISCLHARVRDLKKDLEERQREGLRLASADKAIQEMGESIAEEAYYKPAHPGSLAGMYSSTIFYDDGEKVFKDANSKDLDKYRTSVISFPATVMCAQSDEVFEGTIQIKALSRSEAVDFVEGKTSYELKKEFFIGGKQKLLREFSILAVNTTL